MIILLTKTMAGTLLSFLLIRFLNDFNRKITTGQFLFHTKNKKYLLHPKLFNLLMIKYIKVFGFVTHVEVWNEFERNRFGLMHFIQPFLNKINKNNTSIWENCYQTNWTMFTVNYLFSVVTTLYVKRKIKGGYCSVCAEIN